jgi:hypothetical protein
MMAHFAEVDENNTVLRVLVVPDSEEHRGQEYLANDCLLDGRWIQTSFNRRIRKNFAGVGMTYDEARDAFVYPQPYPSWVLNEETCIWEAPVPAPMDSEFIVVWDEENQRWVETEFPYTPAPNLVIDNSTPPGF